MNRFNTMSDAYRFKHLKRKLSNQDELVMQLHFVHIFLIKQYSKLDSS